MTEVVQFPTGTEQLPQPSGTLPAASPPLPDPAVTLAMAERAIKLLQEDSQRPTIATALALMEQVRDFLIRQQKPEL